MKLIKDTIHGYIKIPRIYCQEFIDTDVFQRLRRIEQTSIRSVFPCAHHDRFVHSLGTFHLGSIAIDFLFKNSENILNELNINSDSRNTLRQTFEIACLLHDCGQAPFSHTFEHYFETANDLKGLLENNINDLDFSDDLNSSDSKPHEKVSAYLVLIYFKNNIAKINSKIDISLIVRMIIGCRYRKSNDPFHQFLNCLIKLLNSDVIDVDKLDYAARDRWASGYNASTVDMERLISSIEISKKNDNYIFCIKKSAMSEVESLIDSRNFLYMWIINHHKVIYEQNLLSKSVNAMLKIMCPSDPDSVTNEIFSINSIINKKEVLGNTIFQLTDDDIIYLLKKYCHGESSFKEWISRKHLLKPLWKSYAEYNEIILSQIRAKDNGPEQIKRCGIKAVERVVNKSPFYVEIVKQKMFRIIENDLFINTENGLIDYYKVAINKRDNMKISPYLYVYVHEDSLNLKEKIIKELKHELS